MLYRSVFRPDLFAEQTVIVTGGGSGIGKGTCLRIAEEGASVAVADIREPLVYLVVFAVLMLARAPPISRRLARLRPAHAAHSAQRL